jgi:hypothetical protein
MTPRILVVTCLLAWVVSITGCACSERIVIGDAHSEPAADAPADMLVDHIHDAAVDSLVDTISDPDPDNPCPPRTYGEMLIDFSFDDDRFLEYDLTLVCTTEEFLDDPDMGTVDIRLLCRSDEGTVEEHHLFFQTDPYAPIDASLFYDSELVLSYVSEPVFCVNRWLTVHNITHGLVLAAMSAESVVPEDREGWYEPLDAWRVGGRCPPEEGYCGRLEREAVEVVGGDTSVVVFDGIIQPLYTLDGGQYHVMVSAAHHYRYIVCEDVPVTWSQALIVRLP